MKRRYYVISGVLAYILFLLTSAPATLLYHLNDQLPQLKLQGLDGTLWHGHAQRVNLLQQHRIDDLNWSFCAWRLLTGELCIELDAKYQDNPFHGQLGKGLGGSVKLRQFNSKADAHILGNLLKLPIGKLSGSLAIDITAASWRQGTAPRIDGIITWNNAAISVAETANLGTVSITLAESDAYPLTATINNKNGQIALEGQANIIDDGTYSLELNLTPGNQASKNIRNSLQMFARKQANGSFLLKNSGNLEQFGLM